MDKEDSGAGPSILWFAEVLFPYIQGQRNTAGYSPGSRPSASPEEKCLVVAGAFVSISKAQWCPPYSLLNAARDFLWPGLIHYHFLSHL